MAASSPGPPILVESLTCLMACLHASHSLMFVSSGTTADGEGGVNAEEGGWVCGLRRQDSSRWVLVHSGRDQSDQYPCGIVESMSLPA